MCRPSATHNDSGFSTYTSLPAWQLWTMWSACQWSGVATTMASRSLALQHLPVIPEPLRITADFLGCEVEVGPINVANRRDLAVFVCQERAENLVATVAQPDESDKDPIIGGKRSTRLNCGGQRRPDSAGGFGELAACDFAHGCSSPVLRSTRR